MRLLKARVDRIALARRIPVMDRSARRVLAVLLIGHGVIHAVWPVEIWGPADLPALTGTPASAVPGRMDRWM